MKNRQLNRLIIMSGSESKTLTVAPKILAMLPPGVHLVKKTLVLTESGAETKSARINRHSEPNSRL